MRSHLPQVSGRTLARLLQQLGYEAARQRGSHLRMTKLAPSGQHNVTVPLHDTVAKGTLADILKAVAQRNGLEVEVLVARLRRL